MEKYIETRILHKIDSAANWTLYNPTLKKGELGMESDTNKLKIGDGLNAWQNLPYATTPIATASQLGTVRIGDNLQITAEGILSAPAPLKITVTNNPDGTVNLDIS